MVATRDPLSERYDHATRRALNAAIDSGTRPRSHTVWVGSPPVEFRMVDKGGRTVHERAFTRSAYYIVRRLPMQQKQVPYWSLQISWSPIMRRSGRWGRVATVRMRRYYSGARHARLDSRRSYIDRQGELRSDVTSRIDRTGIG